MIEGIYFYDLSSEEKGEIYQILHDNYKYSQIYSIKQKYIENICAVG